MNGTHWEDDRRAWRLTSAEYAHYLSRISRYHRKRSVALADKARYYARRAERLSYVGAALAALALITALVAVLL